MPGKTLLKAVMIALLLGTAVGADTTNWMTAKQLDHYVKSQMAGGKAYATDIECGVSNGKAYLRLETAPFRGTPPFHRWQWIMAPTHKFASSIAALRIKSRPELKYGIHKARQFAFDGVPTTCAVLYR